MQDQGEAGAGAGPGLELELLGGDEGDKGREGWEKPRARVELLAAGRSKKTDGRTTLTAQHSYSSTELSSSTAQGLDLLGLVWSDSS